MNWEIKSASAWERLKRRSAAALPLPGVAKNASKDFSGPTFEKKKEHIKKTAHKRAEKGVCYEVNKC